MTKDAMATTLPPVASQDTADTQVELNDTDDDSVLSPGSQNVKSRSLLIGKNGEDDEGEDEISSERVTLLGLGLVIFGMLGFHFIPGMIAEDANGSRVVNSFYCSVITLTTVGFGDICPSQVGPEGRLFLIVLAVGGLGMFCGPILNLASAWKHAVPGGLAALGVVTLAIGVVLFTQVENLSYSEAVHLSIITGTTIGYGGLTPQTDAGRLAVAIYAVLACNVVAALLEPGREYLEGFCRRKRSPVSVSSNKLNSFQISSFLSSSAAGKKE